MYILYEGPSLIDGGPIFVALTGIESPSTNVKTGPLLQTWILRQDVKPIEAHKLGLDRSMCGDCTHRIHSTCYVSLIHGPSHIYNAYINGHGKRDNAKKLGRNQRVRLGAYGDPASVPFDVWEELLTYADDWTGYTHFPLLAPELKRYCQASCETEEQATLYQSLGWKTYRTRATTAPLLPSEIQCPSSKGVQCFTCLKCNGQSSNISIPVHGLKHKIKKFEANYATPSLELQLAHSV